MLYRQNMSIMLSMSKKYGRKSSNWAQKPRTKQRAHKFYESLTQIPNCRNELFCAGPRLGVRYHWTTHRAAAMFWAESWILRCMKIWNGDLHEKKRSTALGEECVCGGFEGTAPGPIHNCPNPRAFSLYSCHHHLLDAHNCDF